MIVMDCFKTHENVLLCIFEELKLPGSDCHYKPLKGVMQGRQNPRITETLITSIIDVYGSFPLNICVLSLAFSDPELAKRVAQVVVGGLKRGRRIG